MEERMPKQAIIFFGPPGSGKGTQALWLEQEAGFFHLESTAIIRAQFRDHPDDPVVAKQKKNVDAGELVDPPVILEWMRGSIEKLAAEGKSIVFSGSPRTVYEARGDADHEGEIPLLSRLYGPENVHIFYLDITVQEAIRRGLARRVCTLNDHPIPDTPEFRNLTVCPWDGSPLRKRPDNLDKDEASIRNRFAVFERRTKPMLDYFGTAGYQVIHLNGADEITSIHAKAVEVLERRRMPVPEE